jgi:hypothetical protein
MCDVIHTWKSLSPTMSRPKLRYYPFMISSAKACLHLDGVARPLAASRMAALVQRSAIEASCQRLTPAFAGAVYCRYAAEGPHDVFDDVGAGRRAAYLGRKAEADDGRARSNGEAVVECAGGRRLHLGLWAAEVRGDLSARSAQSLNLQGSAQLEARMPGALSTVCGDVTPIDT